MSTKIEVKSEKNCIKNKSGKFVKNLKDIKLMNSLGDCSNRTINDVIKFDVLLVIDTGNRNSYCAGYVNASDISLEYLDFAKDGVILKKFPMEKVNIIYDDSKNTHKIPNVKDTFSYQEEKRKMQKKFVESFI